jgi:hypothetical protein
MVDLEIMERSIDSLGSSMADWLRKKNPTITHAEIKESAHNFINLIRILCTIDTEQKAKQNS